MLIEPKSIRGEDNSVQIIVFVVFKTFVFSRSTSYFLRVCNLMEAVSSALPSAYQIKKIGMNMDRPMSYYITCKA
jgi:hypothetical protein